MIRVRLVTTIVAVLVLAAVAVALAKTLTHPVTVDDQPIEAGAPAALALNTSFGRSTHGELSSLELDLAQGFHFDPRAAAICTESRARAGACPAGSVVGRGKGQIVVDGRYLPRTQYAVGATFYLGEVQHRGDLAGIVLDLYEPQSKLHASLIGRVVPLRGRYGLALRFSGTARELPSDYQLTLLELNTLLQARRSVTSSHTTRTYNLLTNPRSCGQGGWPVQLSVSSAGQVRVYRSVASCSGG